MTGLVEAGSGCGASPTGIVCRSSDVFASRRRARNLGQITQCSVYPMVCGVSVRLTIRAAFCYRAALLARQGTLFNGETTAQPQSQASGEQRFAPGPPARLQPHSPSSAKLAQRLPRRSRRLDASDAVTYVEAVALYERASRRCSGTTTTRAISLLQSVPDAVSRGEGTARARAVVSQRLPAPGRRRAQAAPHDDLGAALCGDAGDQRRPLRRGD
mgnify:CR=1 FL=1